MKGNRVILAAHRGDRLKCPENTMPAFESAVKFGVDMIETDVRMSLDGELVIIHDRSALRTTGVDKNIDEMTLSEIRELDAGKEFSKDFIGTRIPTVNEFVDFVKDKDILVNWELKIYPSDFSDEYAFSVADKLIKIITENGLADRSMLNSFSSRVLEYIRKKYGDIFVLHGQGIHNCRRSKDDPEIGEKDIFDWCCLYPEQKGKLAIDYKENFDYCSENGILPCICIPDNYDDYKKAIEYGCKMFTSNDIYACDTILKKLKVR